MTFNEKFDVKYWIPKVGGKLLGWKARMERAGVSSSYIFLSALALYPILEAFRTGDPAGITMLGSIGVSLLVNQFQALKDDADEVDLAHQLAKQIDQDDTLREALDRVLEKLEVLPQAEAKLDEKDRPWFTQTIQEELAHLGSSITYVNKSVNTRDLNQSIVNTGDNSTIRKQGNRSVTFESDSTQNVVITGDYNVMMPNDPTKANPAALRNAYLNYVFESTSQVSLAGIDRKAARESEAQLNLSSIYTALLTQSTEAEEMNLRGEARGEMHPARRLSALEQLNRCIHLVLLGDPGSGKTTFVNFVAMCLAGETLKMKGINLELLRTPLPQEEERLISGDKAAKKPKKQPWDHGELLPVRIILRDFAARGLPTPGEKATLEHLWNFITNELKQVSLGDYVPYLRKELLEKGGLLLVDGLDEVSEAEQRRVQIKQVMEGFAASFSKCRILVTSRTYAYQKQDWRLARFDETMLAPFSTAQIRQFIERWYDHIAVLRSLNLGEAKGKAELLKRAIFNSDRLLGLAERPLLLTLMASLHAWRGGTLPDKREELYHETVELLLDRWESQRVLRDAQGKILDIQPTLTEWLKVKDRQEVRDLLNELAYQAHVSQADLKGTADVPEDKLVMGLMHLNKNPDVNPKTLVEYLSQRAGLLVPRGVGVFTFPHRTFQEYLAACYLTDHDYPEKIAELACQDFNRWREVALLSGAKAARGTSSAIWSLVDALCYNDGEDKPCQTSQLWGAHLAGQALVETANLSQVSERNQPKVARVKQWLTVVLRKDVKDNGLPILERALAGNHLAHLGDPRPEAMTVEAMQFGFVPGGVFEMGETKELHSVDLPDYWMGVYPVTNAQYEAFVQDGGYDIPQYWQEAKKAKVWKGGKVKGRWDDEFRDRPMQFKEPFSLPNHPVVGITWYEALAFTRWLTDFYQKEGWLLKDWQMQLPSEAQWEKAARGGLQIPEKPLVVKVNEMVKSLVGAYGRTPQQNRTPQHGRVPQHVPLRQNPSPERIYPWEGGFEAEKANTGEIGIGATSAVGCFAGGASPYGLQEMSGHVWEWTRSVYKEYPYDPKDGREILGAGIDVLRVLRGGSFNLDVDVARGVSRIRNFPNSTYEDDGFRVAFFPA